MPKNIAENYNPGVGCTSVTDDRQTSDGRATAYSEHERKFTFASKIESCQRWFTKRIKGMSGVQYSKRLAFLNLESLQIRRLKCVLLVCYKIIHNEITILCDDFLVFSNLHAL